MKEITGVIVIFILIQSIAVAELETTIEKKPLSFIAGDAQTISITFKNTEETTIWMNYEIFPSEEGFTLSFSEEPFTFSGEKTIEATIQTSPLLKPDEYTIQINYEYIIEENQPTEEENDDLKERGPIYASGTRAPEPPEEPNKDSDEEIPSSTIQKGSFTFVGNIIDEETREKKQIGQYFIIAGIVFSLLFIMLLSRKKKKQHQ